MIAPKRLQLNCLLYIFTTVIRCRLRFPLKNLTKYERAYARSHTRMYVYLCLILSHTRTICIFWFPFICSKNSIIIAHFSMLPLFSICKLSHSLFFFRISFTPFLALSVIAHFIEIYVYIKMEKNPGRTHNVIITIGSFFINSFRHIFQCICFLFSIQKVAHFVDVLFSFQCASMALAWWWWQRHQ